MLESRIRSLHTFQIDIVHGCQLRCVGCPNSTLLEKVRRIDVGVFRRCLGNVDVEHVQLMRLFNFGEPLLHEDLTGIFQAIKEQPWKPETVEISTNAQFCHWDDFEAALSLGVLTQLVVSCDGDGTPEEYEQLRPPSKWSKLIGFLERAREIRDRCSPDLRLITRTIIENQDAIERWKDVLVPRGWEPEFRDWKVLPEAQENMTSRTVVAPDDLCTFVAPSHRFSEQYYGEVNLLYVDAFGTVVPCCAHPRAAVLGNLTVQPVTELFASEQRKAFIQRLETDRTNMPICNVCEFGPPEEPGESFERLSPDKAEAMALIS